MPSLGSIRLHTSRLDRLDDYRRETTFPFFLPSSIFSRLCASSAHLASRSLAPDGSYPYAKLANEARWPACPARVALSSLSLLPFTRSASPRLPAESTRRFVSRTCGNALSLSRLSSLPSARASAARPRSISLALYTSLFMSAESQPAMRKPAESRSSASASTRGGAGPSETDLASLLVARAQVRPASSSPSAGPSESSAGATTRSVWARALPVRPLATLCDPCFPR